MKTIVIYGLSEQLGGVETIVLSLVNKLADSINFIIVLSDKDNCSYNSRVPSSVKLTNVTSWGSNPNKFKNEFLNILNDSHCDAVWLNACVTSNKEIINAIKSAKHTVKFIPHAHGTNYENDGMIKTFLIKTLHHLNRKIYNETASYRWACSQKAAEWFYGKNNIKDVTIIKNGIDVENFCYNDNLRTELRKQFSCEDSFVCLHIGRLTPVKNQKYLLKVFSELSRLNPSALLFIAGTGELDSELKADAKNLHISEKVRFLGQYNNVSELYSMSDAFLLPSIHEGMPLTLVEAQCAGLQCFVSSNISKEVKLTSFLSFLSINEAPEKWAKYIASYQYNAERGLGRTEIVDAGFDITSISKNVADMIELL